MLENKIFKDFQYSFDKWSKGEHLQATSLDDLPKEAERMKYIYRKFGVKSFVSIPISVAGTTVGALAIFMTRTPQTWSEDVISRVRLVGDIFGNALIRKKNENSLLTAFSEIKKLKEQLEAELVYLTEEIKLEHNFEEIIGNSAALKTVLYMTQQVAPTNSTVLISGETGTGKELIARAIHSASKRKDRALIKINCAALSPTLIESELFGHEKGAYTGAGDKRKGRFELADGATLFLDEIGELPLDLQPKLLRFLQEGEFERVGGNQTIKSDVRVIAATNRDLEKEIENGRFRQDLWYRLNIFPIHIPPLRKHPEDIPWLARWFIKKYSKNIGKHFDKIPQKTIAALQNHNWPGNIRELENIIERAVITSLENKFHIEIPETSKTNFVEKRTIEDIERNHIVSILNETNWKIEGKGGAAGILGLKPSTLRNRMKKLNIRR
jgi:transcriptional regulator with GAF, ATPase, and Fis domain